MAAVRDLMAAGDVPALELRFANPEVFKRRRFWRDAIRPGLATFRWALAKAPPEDVPVAGIMKNAIRIGAVNVLDALGPERIAAGFPAASKDTERWAMGSIEYFLDPARVPGLDHEALLNVMVADALFCNRVEVIQYLHAHEGDAALALDSHLPLLAKNGYVESADALWKAYEGRGTAVDPGCAADFMINAIAFAHVGMLAWGLQNGVFQLGLHERRLICATASRYRNIAALAWLRDAGFASGDFEEDLYQVLVEDGSELVLDWLCANLGVARARFHGNPSLWGAAARAGNAGVLGWMLDNGLTPEVIAAEDRKLIAMNAAKRGQLAVLKWIEERLGAEFLPFTEIVFMSTVVGAPNYAGVIQWCAPRCTPEALRGPADEALCCAFAHDDVATLACLRANGIGLDDIERAMPVLATLCQRCLVPRAAAWLRGIVGPDNVPAPNFGAA